MMYRSEISDVKDSYLKYSLQEWAYHMGFAYHPKVFGIHVIYSEKSGQGFSKKVWDRICFRD